MFPRITKLLIIISLFLYILFLLVWWTKLPRNNVTIVIPPGTSAIEIASILYKKDILPYPKIFLGTLKLIGKTKDLKAGIYIFSPRDSLFKIVYTLVKGKTKYARVTIPEGFDSKQIAERLSELYLIDKDKFLNIVDERKLEGYLYPETYFFDMRCSEESIIKAMENEFWEKITPEINKKAKNLKMSFHKIVTLASLIEKEAVSSEEKPLISSVFHNRLRKRWRLESDPTVLYALGRHKKRVFYKDLEIDSPYNTYKYYGLPPGPICSPGIESINAALNPAKTDYMFFVVNSSCSHKFSVSYREHLKHKRLRKKRLEESIKD